VDEKKREKKTMYCSFEFKGLSRNGRCSSKRKKRSVPAEKHKWKEQFYAYTLVIGIILRNYTYMNS